MGAAGVDGPFSPRERDRVLFGVATFFYWASLYLYVPILPVYAQSVVDSLAMVGLVMSSYALPQLLMRIPIGMYYDSVARRKPLVLASMAMCLGAVSYTHLTLPTNREV